MRQPSAERISLWGAHLRKEKRTSGEIKGKTPLRQRQPSVSSSRAGDYRTTLFSRILHGAFVWSTSEARNRQPPGADTVEIALSGKSLPHKITSVNGGVGGNRRQIWTFDPSRSRGPAVGGIDMGRMPVPPKYSRALSTPITTAAVGKSSSVCPTPPCQCNFLPG